MIDTREYWAQRWEKTRYEPPPDWLVTAATQILDELPIRGTVLDFGCGIGRWTQILSCYGSRYVGCDRDAAAIERARRQFPQHEFTTVESAPQADLLFTNSVIIHLEDQDAAQIPNLVAPGGSVLMLERYYDAGTAPVECCVCRTRKEFHDLWPKDWMVTMERQIQFVTALLFSTPRSKD